MKQVVILAGGKGTRLRERLGDLPKPLIDLCGVPLLERQIMLVKRYGFARVLILVNYQAERIVEFCQNNDNWGLNIQCIDDGTPRGTAGAVLEVFDHLGDEFLVMYGDTMLEVDLQRFYRYHTAAAGVAATLFVHPNDHPHDSDLVDTDEQGYITCFHPYPHDLNRYYPNLVNAALYWIRKSALARWRGISDGLLDFGKQVFPAMIAQGFALRAYNSPEYIKDCGTPARLDKVSVDFHSGKIARSALDHEQLAVFTDRDGTLNRQVDHLNSVDQLVLLHGVEEAIRRLNLSEYRVCVVTNQPVIARGECSRETLHQIHNKLETLLGRKGAFLDRIYYCPHHPDRGFESEIPELKIDCDCRKPKTGMIDRAVAELNIVRNRSWMIGDTTTDIALARRAGLKSILLETGYAGLDQKHWVSPDFVMPDLAAAVALILDIYPILVEQIKPLTQNIMPGDVIFVGGQSRSGKTTFASTVRHVLVDRGLRCHLLSTDRWLLSEEDRGDVVLARHAAKNLHAVVKSICNPRERAGTLKLPGYRKDRREHVHSVETLELMPRDVFIVEGVVALHFATAMGAAHRFFVDIDEVERRRRVIREYKNRGCSEEGAETIYLKRLAEEVPWVNATSAHAIRVRIPFNCDNSTLEQPA